MSDDLFDKGMAARKAVLAAFVLSSSDPTNTNRIALGMCTALLALSRQAFPTLDRDKYASASGLAKGAYVLADAPGGTPDRGG